MSGNSRRTVVVTGCTRGIGRAIFKWFCVKGDFDVAGCGTDSAELDKLCIAHRASHTRASKVDICDESAVSSWIQDVTASFGMIDVLVSCAGCLPELADFQDISEEDWQLSCEVNVMGVARVLRNAVPHLRSPGATVVVMSSRYGRSVVKSQAAYCATKWSTEGMAKALALELMCKGVTVVPLDPGIVNTSMLRKSCPGPEGAEWCSQQRSPEDFAAEVAPFILSLTIADTGRSLTSPGSPAHYFQTGMAYKNRPAWANGIGPFVRAIDDSDDTDHHAKKTEAE